MRSYSGGNVLQTNSQGNAPERRGRNLGRNGDQRVLNFERSCLLQMDLREAGRLASEKENERTVSYVQPFHAANDVLKRSGPHEPPVLPKVLGKVGGNCQRRQHEAKPPSPVYGGAIPCTAADARRKPSARETLEMVRQGL